MGRKMQGEKGHSGVQRDQMIFSSVGKFSADDTVAEMKTPRRLAYVPVIDS